MNINFKNFSVRNGGCIVEADMPLENQGLVLIRGVNHDEGGSNGSGKCVDGSTLIETDKGLVRIDSLFDGQEPEDTMIPEEGLIVHAKGVGRITHKITKVHDSYVTITCDTGVQLTGSKVHPVLVFCAETRKLLYKKMENITTDDYMVINRKYHIQNENSYPISINKEIKEIRNTQKISNHIFQANDINIRSFLRSYFDRNGEIEGHELACYSGSEEFLSDIQQLLLKLGIISIRRGKQNCYKLTISNIYRFKKLVGFNSKEKEYWLDDVCRYDLYDDSIPCLRNSDRETVNQVLEHDYYLDKVQTVSIKNEEKRLYDLCVEDEHSYTANGIVVHNSSLFDLLASAATGRTGKSVGSRTLKKNDLLNIANPKDFHTQLIFEKAGSEYIINSYRAHRDYGTRIEILVDGVDETPTTKLDDVQAKVASILGFTPDEFYGQIYLCQQYSHALVHGTPAEKRKYLSLYFGLEAIDLVMEVSKKRLNSIQIPNEAELLDLKDSVIIQLTGLPDISLISNLKTSAEVETKQYQKRVLDLRYTIDNQLKAKKVEEQTKEWAVTVASLGVSFNLKAMQQQEQEDTSKIEVLKAEVKRLTELYAIDQQLQQLGITTEASYTELRKQIIACEYEIRDKTEVLNKLQVRFEKELELNKLPATEKDLETLISELNQANLESKIYIKNLDTLTVEIQKLSFKGTKCPTCFRSITEEEHQKLLCSRQENYKNLKPVVDNLLESINNLKVLAQAKERSLALQEEISKLPEGNLKEAYMEVAKLEQHKLQLQQLADVVVQVTSLQDRKRVLEESDPKLNINSLDLNSLISDLTSKVLTLRRAREWLIQNGQTKFDMSALGLAQEELRIVEDQLAKANETVLEQTRLLATHQQLSKQLEDVSRILAKNSEEKQRKRILEVVHGSIINVKKKQLKKATEVLTSVLPHYISQLFPNSGVTVYSPDEGTEFDLFLNKGNQNIPLAAASGGQAKRVALAIFFAFSQMGTKSSNILMTDEIFKDLDPKGREACYEVLRDLKVPSIFVTSHDNDLQSLDKYDQVWQMVMKNSTSRLHI
jgi:hypothetical protein